MKKFANKAIWLFAILGIASCAPETPVQPEKNLSVTLKETSVTLPFETEVKVDYTYADAEGTLVVDSKNLPEGISFTNKVTSLSEGSISFFSRMDSDKEYKVSLIFGDRNKSITKDITLKTLKKETPFSIDIESSEISLVYDENYKLDYTAISPKGEVSAQFKNAVEGITLSNAFNKETNKGVLTFKTSLKEAKDLSGIIVFTDGKTTQEKELKFKTGAWSVKPSEPVVELTSDIVYPYPSNIATEIPFTVKCESTIDEVTVEAGTGLKATINAASDKKSGKISVVAESNLGTSANVTITAKNSAGSASKSFSLVKAYLDLSGYECSVPYTGTKQAYNFIVSTNLEYNVNVENAAREYVNCTVQNNSVNFNVTENPKWETRVAKITVFDKKKILSREFVITQAMTEGSNASDREALMAIYESLNMKEWTDYGSFGTYYKNWGTDVSMDKWLGLDWSDYDGKGRCVYIHLVGLQPNSTGVIPEEIGHLTKLREFRLYPGHHITKLPDSIKNLINLKDLTFTGDELDMDLSDWTGFNELMNNPNCKLQGISFDDTRLHGNYPEWTTKFDKDGQLGITGCHFSGQVPDAVAKCEFWKKKYAYDANALEACPRFDKSKYTKSEDGWYYFVPQGEAMMFLQADNYALWVGERPSNTTWVNDKFGGHWEWTD